LEIEKNKFLTFIDKFSKFGQALPYLGNAIFCSDQLVRFFSFLQGKSARCTPPI